MDQDLQKNECGSTALPSRNQTNCCPCVRSAPLSVCRYLWPGGRVVGGPVGEGREPLQCDVSLVILADLHLE